jgi:hypothetical protein
VDRKLDRYFASQNVMLRWGGGGIIALLLTVIGYLVSHGGIPVIH